MPLPSLHAEEGSSLLGSVPPSVTVDSESMLDITLPDSGVVNGYQVDEFIDTLLAEHFVAQFHIYPEFLGKLTSLTHFPYKPRHEEGVDFIVSDSVKMPEMDAFLMNLTSCLLKSLQCNYTYLVLFLII